MELHGLGDFSNVAAGIDGPPEALILKSILNGIPIFFKI